MITKKCNIASKWLAKRCSAEISPCGPWDSYTNKEIFDVNDDDVGHEKDNLLIVFFKHPSFEMCEIFCSLWCCQLENFLRLFLSIYQLKAKHQIKTIKKFPNFIQCQQSSIYVLGQRMQSRSSSTLKVFFINSKQFLLDKLIFLSRVQKSVSWPSLSWPARYF